MSDFIERAARCRRAVGRAAGARRLAALVVTLVGASWLSGCPGQQCMRCCVACYDTVDEGQGIVPREPLVRGPLDGSAAKAGMAY